MCAVEDLSAPIPEITSELGRGLRKCPRVEFREPASDKRVSVVQDLNPFNEGALC